MEGKQEVYIRKTRNVRMDFLVTTDEAEAIENRAHREGMKRSQWLRYNVLKIINEKKGGGQQ